MLNIFCIRVFPLIDWLEFSYFERSSNFCFIALSLGFWILVESEAKPDLVENLETCFLSSGSLSELRLIEFETSLISPKDSVF